MIKQLLNSVIAKYLDLSVSRRSIICLSLRLGQIIDLLATDKSRYFAQPRPLIVNCFHFSFSLFFLQTSYLLSQKWKQFSRAIRKTCLLCWGLLVTQSATQTSERVKRDADAFVKYSWLSWRELQQTLIYASTYWTDKTRFDSEETKLATYSSSSFNKVCLGTRFENQDTFFVINKTLTPCSQWSLVTFSTPYRLVGIRGESFLVTRGCWSHIATQRGLIRCAFQS